jgi:single-strand DNA-binding protein
MNYLEVNKMANDINHLTIIGRMTRDIDILTTTSGTKVGKFSIASNRKYGEKDEVSFFNCVAWGKTAEIMGQYTGKGKQICIDGRLQQNRWQDQAGNKKSAVEIVVERLQLLGGNKPGQESEGNAPPEPQTAASKQGEPEQPDFLDDDIPF